MLNLLELLKLNGGKIVSSNDCNQLEITEVRSCNRMWVDDNGFGFIYFPPEEKPQV